MSIFKFLGGILGFVVLISFLLVAVTEFVPADRQESVLIVL